MITAFVCVVLSTSGCTDLLSVNANYGPIAFYRISTEDASVELVTSFEHANPGIGVLTLGPDGHHYGLSFDGTFRVDPRSGHTEPLHDFGDTGPTGAFTTSDDGVLYSGFRSYASAYMLGWDIETDEFTTGITWNDNDFAAAAAHIRADGELVVSRWSDPVLYRLNRATGELEPIGSFGNDIMVAYDFGVDRRTGQTYAVFRRHDDTHVLSRVDLFTATRTDIGPLPDFLYSVAGITTCLADVNEDFALDVLDFIAFQQAWQAGELAADINADGVLDLLDFVAFQALFVEGC